MAAASAMLADVREAFAASASLKQKAATKGLSYGCAVKSRVLIDDTKFALNAVLEADTLVPEYELKREITQAKSGSYDFYGADQIVTFGQTAGQRVRGHTLAWYAANPPWLEASLRGGTRANAEALLTGYINVAMKRYAGRIGEWDVVNEAVEPQERGLNAMRVRNVWFEMLGEQYIDLAFQAARQADPKSRLFLADYSVEANTPGNEERRNAVLRLIERLKKRGVPVDGFAVQGHLKPFQEPFSQTVFARFLDELKGFGLKIGITEFDLADRGGPGNWPIRDRKLADAARNFLDVAFANTAVKSLLTWGLTDRYSWLSTYPDYKWPDGTYSRGLPLDSNYWRKPLYYAIAAALDAAPTR
jgi:endo-1,4-beta-xylanase